MVRMPFCFSYRHIIYVAVFLTGFASLCGQVIWQKYLSILVGSEARSQSLVVAVFLFGLAAGYYFFGRLTEKKNWTRRLLLKTYGYIEIATACYFIVFGWYFHVLEALSFNSPSYLIVDIFISFLALFFPTFLMGASIPLLTAVLPESSEEVNSVHARIYGWNTLGAFFGVLVSAFLWLPYFGFFVSLIFAGVLNLLAGLVFAAGGLKGEVVKKEEVQSIPSSLPGMFLVFFVFMTGAVVISCEILFIRLLNVTIGARVYNFPIVLSLFVGGLGLGSLLLPKKPDLAFFIRQMALSALFLFFTLWTGPYWGIWLSHIRVTLTNIPFSYYIFNLDVYLFLFLFIFPAAFFMGRLLPLSYSLLKKSRQNYGRLCGFLYFSNTLGTVFGAVVIGYLLFYFFDLDRLFQINLFILMALTGAVLFYEKKIKTAVVAGVLSLGLWFFPEWDRTHHVYGLFRIKQVQPSHFQSWFQFPKQFYGKVSFFKDGPNTTVAVTENYRYKHLPLIRQVIPQVRNNYAVFVNGKSDGSFVGGDFTTMFLASALPYLMVSDTSSMSTAVIGLGTGISAAVLGKMRDVKEVDVLEISSQVIQGLKSISSYKFEVMSNPKINIIEKDAFKYFTKTNKKFDLIVSEPSNPWVAGVENLFSREFYELALKKLNKGGVLSQWFYLYSMDDRVFKMILSTLSQVFPYYEMYIVNRADVLILAGSTPFRQDPMIQKIRFLEPSLHTIHKALGFSHADDIMMLKVFGKDKISRIAQDFPVTHSLTHPKLTYMADRSFFMNQTVNLHHLSRTYFESPEEEKIRFKKLEPYLQKTPQEVMKLCLPASGFNVFCRSLAEILQAYHNYKDSSLEIRYRYESYSKLRERGWVPYDRDFLAQVKSAVIRDRVSLSVLGYYILQVISDLASYEEARADVLDFESARLIARKQDKEYLLDIISKAQYPLSHDKTRYK